MVALSIDGQSNAFAFIIHSHKSILGFKMNNDGSRVICQTKQFGTEQWILEKINCGVMALAKWLKQKENY